MTTRIIKKGFQTIRNDGIVHATSKLINYIGRYILNLYRDYNDYLLSILLGPNLALRVCVEIFKFKCMHNLFANKQKALWLGRRTRHRALNITLVNPSEIKYSIKGGIVPYIQDGDWDMNKQEFELNETIKELFIDNIPIQETKQYKTMKNAIINNDWHTSRDCRTQHDLEAYFQTFKDIYNDLSNGKYLTQKDVKPTYIDRRPKSYPNEILLSIDRNGEYMLESGGTHRLSIAKLLGIKLIPAIVIRKHYLYIESKEDWIS